MVKTGGKRVKIDMEEAEAPDRLTRRKWDVGVVGAIVDERGRTAMDFVQENCATLASMEYDSERFTVRVGDGSCLADTVEGAVADYSGRSILLETTTLGFAEILLACRAFMDLRVSELDMIYIEPARYTLRQTTLRRSQLLHRRDFELSERVPGYRAIPGFARILSDKTAQQVVFFLGYEEHRLDRALEEYQMIRPSSCAVVFGVPAFRPGWEMDAFANNIRIIRERNLVGGVHFCGAESPAGAYDVLEEVRDESKGKAVMFVAPIGTKPNGIGVALFVLVHRDVAILYDHPKRQQGRTASVGRWHLYHMDFREAI
jgi:hypothetical protein